jgi:ribosomal protein L40E
MNVEFKNSAPAPKSIRRYLPEELEKIFTGIKQSYDVGLLESADVDAFMDIFKFKDTAQRYWTVGIQSGQWFYFSGQGWKASAKPTVMLEGASDLSMFSIPPKRRVPAAEKSELASLLDQINKRTGQNFANLLTATKYLLDSYTNSAKTTETDSSVCSKCGTKINPEAKFCRNCGEPAKPSVKTGNVK